MGRRRLTRMTAKKKNIIRERKKGNYIEIWPNKERKKWRINVWEERIKHLG